MASKEERAIRKKEKKAKYIDMIEATRDFEHLYKTWLELHKVEVITPNWHSCSPECDLMMNQMASCWKRLPLPTRHVGMLLSTIMSSTPRNHYRFYRRIVHLASLKRE